MSYYDYGHLVLIERTATRAATAAKVFATSTSASYLDEGLHILAEVRHAGRTLCNPEATPEEKANALERLAGLFAENKE